MFEKGKRYFRIFIYVLFIICCCISFVLLSYLLRPVSNSRRNICGFYAEEDQSLDVIYVGGSACYVYWEPLKAWKDYGFTSYNFALDALQPQVIKYVLQETQKAQSPELYIIDIRPFQYGDLYSEQDNTENMNRVAPFRNLSDNMKYSATRAKMINDLAPRQEESWTFHLDIAKYHSNLYAFFNPENWQCITNEKRSKTKGFIFHDETEPILFVDTSNVTEELPLAPEMDKLFLDLLEYCREEELRVLFVVHAYGNSIEDQQKYNYMERRIVEYGYDFLNVNDFFYEIGFDVNRDFRNADHVNLLGAEKYSTFLAQYLVNNYNLPDKRSNPQYAQWNEDYMQWISEIEQTKKTMHTQTGG